MSDDQFALSTSSSPPPPSDADYDAILAAVMETVRGRWFLAEFGRRNRQSDTRLVLAAIERLESMVRGEHENASFERIRFDIREMAKAIALTKREIAAIKPDHEHSGRIGKATEELDSIVQTTQQATSDILAAAELIQETAWTLREQGVDGTACDQIDQASTDIYLSCSFQDLTGQRTRKVIQVMRYLEGRINAMLDILGVDESDTAPPEMPTGGPQDSHATDFDNNLDQAEIDQVMPAVHAASAWDAGEVPAYAERVAGEASSEGDPFAATIDHPLAAAHGAPAWEAEETPVHAGPVDTTAPDAAFTAMAPQAELAPQAEFVSDAALADAFGAVPSPAAGDPFPVAETRAPTPHETVSESVDVANSRDPEPGAATTIGALSEHAPARAELSSDDVGTAEGLPTTVLPDDIGAPFNAVADAPPSPIAEESDLSFAMGPVVDEDDASSPAESRGETAAPRALDQPGARAPMLSQPFAPDTQALLADLLSIIRPSTPDRDPVETASEGSASDDVIEDRVASSAEDGRSVAADYALPLEAAADDAPPFTGPAFDSMSAETAPAPFSSDASEEPPVALARSSATEPPREPRTLVEPGLLSPDFAVVPVPTLTAGAQKLPAIAAGEHVALPDDGSGPLSMAEASADAGSPSLPDGLPDYGIVAIEHSAAMFLPAAEPFASLPVPAAAATGPAIGTDAAPALAPNEMPFTSSQSTPGPDLDLAALDFATPAARSETQPTATPPQPQTAAEAVAPPGCAEIAMPLASTIGESATGATAAAGSSAATNAPALAIGANAPTPEPAVPPGKTTPPTSPANRPAIFNEALGAIASLSAEEKIALFS